MPDYPAPVDDRMSPAERLADSEVAVTTRTPDPLEEREHVNVQRINEIDAADVRAADEADRSRIWADLVSEFGHTEASRRWLVTFAATDAPRTG